MAQASDFPNTLQESLVVFIIDVDENPSKKQNPPDINAELIRYVLLRMSHTDSSKQELFNHIQEYANKTNDYSRHISKQFLTEYEPAKALWWYTKSSFLFEKLNKALRDQDIDFLYGTRHILVDLHNQLREFHANFDCQQKLYRGSNMEDYQLEKLHKNIGELLYFGQFLSTSIDEEIAKGFIRKAIGSRKSVLFRIDISLYAPRVDSDDNPYARIDELSERPEEKEILFSPGCIFCIKKIEWSTNEEIWYIDLELTSARDQNLKEYSDSIKREIHSNATFDTNLVSLAKLMKRFGQYNDALKFYDLALKCPIINKNEETVAIIYNDQALIYIQTSDLTKARQMINKAWNTKCSSENDDIRCALLNTSGMIHTHAGNQQIARERFKEALVLLEKQGPNVDIRKRATTLNNIALTYINEENYAEALETFSKVLGMQENMLLKNQREIARTYTNMSTCYLRMGDNDNGRKYSEMADKINRKLLPDNHPSVSYSTINYAVAGKRLGEIDEAYAGLEAARDNLIEALSYENPIIKHIDAELKSFPF